MPPRLGILRRIRRAPAVQAALPGARRVLVGFPEPPEGAPDDFARAYAARAVAASRRSAGPSGERRRHTSAIVLFGAGCAKGRIDSNARLDSVGTASKGRRVTPAPPATICASVERLVARNSSSRVFEPAQKASTCSRKQCPSSRSRTLASRNSEAFAGDAFAPSGCPAGAASTNGSRPMISCSTSPMSASSARSAASRFPASRFRTRTLVLSSIQRAVSRG